MLVPEDVPVALDQALDAAEAVPVGGPDPLDPGKTSWSDEDVDCDAC
jgi:hypothetical protein